MKPWDVFPGALTERLALTLVHFVWQGCAIATAAWILSALLPIRRPAGKYALDLLALLVMAVCPMLTFSSLRPLPASLAGESTPPDLPVDSLPEPVEPPSLRVATEPLQQMVPATREAQAVRPGWFPEAQRRLVLAWLAGVGVLSARLLFGWAWLRWLRWHVEPAPEILREQATRLSRALRLRVPRIGVCRQVGEVIATGLVRPLILLPAAWLTELPPDMLEAVLAHELAHLRRWDLWVNLLQRLMETLLFYHPAVWWLSYRLRLERELCCDEDAARLIGDRLRYVQTLERVGRMLVSETTPGLAMSLGGNRMTLLYRVQQLLQPQPARLSAMPWLAALLALTMPVAVWWFALASPTSQGNAAEQPAEEAAATVVDMDGRPVPNVDVQVYYEGRRTSRAFRTDAQGQFKFPRAWQAKRDWYTLVAQDRGRIGWRNFTLVPMSEAVDTSMRIVLLPFDQTVQGELTDATGKGLAAVAITALSLNHDSNFGIVFHASDFAALFPVTSTDQHGRFALKLPHGVTGRLASLHRDWVFAQISVKKGEENIGRIQLDAAGRIEGRVLDAGTGKSVAGATIIAQDYRQGGGAGWGEAVSDEQGNYVLGGLRPGQYNSLFTARPNNPKLTAPAVEAIEVRAGVAARADFRAMEGRLLSGQVVEKSNGKPLPNCHVGYSGSARPLSGMMVRTDDEGKFHLYVPPGPSRISIGEGNRTHLPDSEAIIEVLADQDPEPLVLQAGPIRNAGMYSAVCPTPEQIKQQQDRSYRLDLIFRAGNGGTVGKVDLRLVYGGNRHYSQWSGRSGTTADMRFNQSDDGQKAFFLVDAAGFAPTRSADFTIAKTMPPLTIDLRPAEFGRVSGRVVDPNRQPVVGARVRTGRMIYYADQEFPWGVETKTDRNGRFELKHVRVGDRFYVRIDKPGTGGALSGRLFAAKNEPITLPDFCLGSPDQIIRGRVFEPAADAPIAGAKVICQAEPARETTTDAAGRFEFRGLPIGKFEVKVSAPGYESPPPTPFAAGNTDANVYVSRPLPPDITAYRYTIHLRPRDGKAVLRTWIWILDAEKHRPLWVHDFSGNEYETSSFIDFRCKPGGKITVVLAPEGYVQPRPFTIVTRKNLAPVVLDLEPAAPVTARGRVVDESGKPIGGAKAGLAPTLLESENSPTWPFVEESSVTDVAGRFQIKGVQPGSRFAVYVNTPGYDGVWSPGVVAEKAKDVEFGDLVLKKATGKLAGRVVDAQGRPVTQARVYIDDFGRVETSTDADGRFQLQVVPGTKPWLVVDSPDHEIHSRQVAVDTTNLIVTLPVE